ncbi:hypothetical protein PR202_gb29570 [Eleusine coracana subsp. coracana]|uniref:Uncharacterized protein n=1 Tax=Eleusine coracana subsp. coracana TaxID=191504 RepID=A0AAV5FXD2_ELECO|nr:hypothetical protein PR202_gb29570 [Eleusine coracana subsp. coracana]
MARTSCPRRGRLPSCSGSAAGTEDGAPLNLRRARKPVLPRIRGEGGGRGFPGFAAREEDGAAPDLRRVRSGGPGSPGSGRRRKSRRWRRWGESRDDGSRR